MLYLSVFGDGRIWGASMIGNRQGKTESSLDGYLSWMSRHQRHGSTLLGDDWARTRPCGVRKRKLRRFSQLLFRIGDQFSEHLDGRNTWRLERIFCGITPNRRSVERSPVFIVFGGAAIHNKHVL
jgi:hypothetical protein